MVHINPVKKDNELFGKEGKFGLLTINEKKPSFIRVDQENSKALLQILNFLGENKENTDLLELRDFKTLLTELKRKEEVIESELEEEGKEEERSKRIDHIFKKLMG